MLGFSGVRKGDLNGLSSVLFASFNRRRLACGVDIFAVVVALGSDRDDVAKVRNLVGGLKLRDFVVLARIGYVIACLLGGKSRVVRTS